MHPARIRDIPLGRRHALIAGSYCTHDPALLVAIGWVLNGDRKIGVSVVITRRGYYAAVRRR